MDDEREEVTPTPEPVREPSDPHQMPLDDERDYVWLSRGDPRRKAIERKLFGN
jgi:hypothetical protein